MRDSSSPKEIKQLVQETNTFSTKTEEYNYLPIAPEHDNKNNEPAAASASNEMYNNIASEKCDENGKSIALDWDNVNQKHDAFEADGETYKPLAPKYCIDSQRPIAPEAGGEMYEALPPSYDDIFQTSIAAGADGGKYKPMPLKLVDLGRKQIFPEIHGEKYKPLTHEGAYMNGEEKVSELHGDKRKQNVFVEKCRSTLEEDYGEVKVTAPELDYGEWKGAPRKDSEKYKTFLLKEDPEKVKPSAPELDDDSLPASKEENPIAATNFDKYRASSYPEDNYQRQKEKPLGRSNDMHNLTVVGLEDLNPQPQNVYTNNFRSFNFTNNTFPIITTQPTPSNRFGQSDDTDCCNDACCSGDCGGDDCCKDDCCEGDCGGDDCCKDDCCDENCCRDCCTDEQVIEICCECLCVCIIALFESCDDRK